MTKTPRHAFSRAARDYGRYDRVQRECFRRLSAGLPGRALAAADLGGGDGRLARDLSGRYPAAHITAVEAAPGMADTARRRSAGFDRVRIVERDLLDWTDSTADTYDVVISNAVLHWLPAGAGIIPRLVRVLRPGGTLLLSIFGPGSYGELTQCLRAHHSDHQTAAVSFLPLDQWSKQLRRLSSTTLEMERLRYIQHFPTLLQLLRSMKGAGVNAAPPGTSVPPGLAFSRRTITLYESWMRRTFKTVRASFEILLVRLTV